jgi:hypothetical protein
VSADEEMTSTVCPSTSRNSGAPCVLADSWEAHSAGHSDASGYLGWNVRPQDIARWFGALTAQRDRLRKQLATVLGEFSQDRDEYRGAVLDLWQGCLTSEEMETARAALEVDCE